MKTLPILITLLTTQVSTAAVLSRSVNLSAFNSGSKSISFLTDNTGELFFRGQAICTDDIPSSFCSYSVSIRGREGVEFFISNSTSRAQALAPGTEVSNLLSGGSWQTPSFNSLLVSFREHPLAPETSGYVEEYQNLSNVLIGFRIANPDESFNYGWIDVALGTPFRNQEGEITGLLRAFPQVKTAFLETSPDAPIRIAPIPEPSTGALLIFSLFLVRRRQP